MPVLINGYYKNFILIWFGEKRKEVLLRSIEEALLRFNEKTSVYFFKPPRGRTVDQIDVSSVKIIKKKKQVQETRYSLKPLQNGTFSYNGNSIIISITLHELTFAIRGTTSPNLVINSPDVLHALKHDIKEISLRSGKLVHAKFQFVLDIDGKKSAVTFGIIPPNVTDLGSKPYSHIIEDYLEEYGVKR